MLTRENFSIFAMPVGKINKVSNSFAVFVLRLHFNLTNLSIKIILNITKADRVISKYQKGVFIGMHF